MLIEKFTHIVRWACAAELVDQFTLHKQEGGREATQLVAPGQLHVLVGLDFGQHESPGIFIYETFEHRR